MLPAILCSTQEEAHTRPGFAPLQLWLAAIGSWEGNLLQKAFLHISLDSQQPLDSQQALLSQALCLPHSSWPSKGCGCITDCLGRVFSCMSLWHTCECHPQLSQHTELGTAVGTKAFSLPSYWKCLLQWTLAATAMTAGITVTPTMQPAHWSYVHVCSWTAPVLCLQTTDRLSCHASDECPRPCAACTILPCLHCPKQQWPLLVLSRSLCRPMASLEQLPCSSKLKSWLQRKTLNKAKCYWGAAGRTGDKVGGHQCTGKTKWLKEEYSGAIKHISSLHSVVIPGGLWDLLAWQTSHCYHCYLLIPFGYLSVAQSKGTQKRLQQKQMVSAPMQAVTGLSYPVLSELAQPVKLQWLQERFELLKGRTSQLLLLLR